MLGLRSVPKEYSAVSAAEAVFGSSLTLPEKFLTRQELPFVEFLQRIQNILKKNPISLTDYKSVPISTSLDKIPKSLEPCTHVLIREDMSKPPLSQLYRGLFLVVSHTPKYFTVQIGSRIDSVSVDHLKPVLSKVPVVAQLPPCTGRPPRPPTLMSLAPISPVSMSPAPKTVCQTPPPIAVNKRKKVCLSPVFKSSSL